MRDSSAIRFDLIHRPALRAFAARGTEQLRLVPMAEGTVVQIFGLAGDVRTIASAMSVPEEFLRPNGPGQWFFVADEGSESLPQLVENLPPDCSAIDQSHGRVRIAVEGDAVEAMLAKGTGIDLASFAIGGAATTLIGHIATHLTRVAADKFELMVSRTFAESLWLDLERMGAEYLAPAANEH